MIFKWQTEKYRLELSAWYRTALFFLNCNSCLTCKLPTTCSKLWTSCTEFYIQTRSQSCNEINTHTEHLRYFKNTIICFNWKEAISSLTKKKRRKQERKGNRIITLDGENSKKVELQHWSQKTLRKQNHQPPKPQSGSK